MCFHLRIMPDLCIRIFLGIPCMMNNMMIAQFELKSQRLNYTSLVYISTSSWSSSSFAWLFTELTITLDGFYKRTSLFKLSSYIRFCLRIIKLASQNAWDDNYPDWLIELLMPCRKHRAIIAYQPGISLYKRLANYLLAASRLALMIWWCGV